jgi:hypothetical protein
MSYILEENADLLAMLSQGRTRDPEDVREPTPGVPGTPFIGPQPSFSPGAGPNINVPGAPPIRPPRNLGPVPPKTYNPKIDLPVGGPKGEVKGTTNGGSNGETDKKTMPLALLAGGALLLYFFFRK